MTEINRLTKLFTDLQHGECWLDINFKEALRGVNAATAAKNIDGKTNSIWLLVFHLVYWRLVVINRLNGSTDHPPFQDFTLPDELTEENWKQLLTDFETTYHQLIHTLRNFKEEQLDTISPKPDQTYHELIVGCLQHDSYHLGQIILLKKVVG